jgi:hypothetical protein
MPTEDLDELANTIRESRKLPYSLTVEKIEGNKIHTRNIWGNIIIYTRKTDGHFELLKE